MAGRCRLSAVGCRVSYRDYDWRSTPCVVRQRQPENIRVLHRRMHVSHSKSKPGAARSGQGAEGTKGDEMG